MQWEQLLFRSKVALGYGLERTGLISSRVKSALDMLRRSANPQARLLTKAIERSASKHAAAEDKAWFDRIESVRQKLLRSDEVLHRKDFGAGHALDIDGDPEPVIRTTTVSKLCSVAGTPSSQARLLYYVVKGLQPANCLELGTCLGISAAYQGAALPPGSKLITIEGDPATAALARKNLRELGLGNVEVVSGSFAEVLPETLVRLKQIDFVLIDGHHDGEAMKNYYALIKPWLSAGACVVFDDIDWSAGMKRAWEELRKNMRPELSIDLGRMGILLS